MRVNGWMTFHTARVNKLLDNNLNFKVVSITESNKVKVTIGSLMILSIRETFLTMYLTDMER